MYILNISNINFYDDEVVNIFSGFKQIGHGAQFPKIDTNTYVYIFSLIAVFKIKY